MALRHLHDLSWCPPFCLFVDQSAFRALGSLAVGSSGLCRTCYFDTLLFKEQEQLEEGGGGEMLMPDYAPCPCCVLTVYGQAYAQDEDGQRCKSPKSLYLFNLLLSKLLLLQAVVVFVTSLSCSPKNDTICCWADSSRYVHATALRASCRDQEQNIALPEHHPPPPFPCGTHSTDGLSKLVSEPFLLCGPQQSLL